MVGRHLGAVVAAKAFRYTSHCEQLRKRINHVLARDIAIHFQRKALSSVFVHDRQPLQSAARNGAVKGEVPTLHVVGMLRAIPNDSVLARTTPLTFLAFSRHF